MPGREITRQQNKTAKALLLFLFLCSLAWATFLPAGAQEPATQEPSKPSGNDPSPSESQDNNKLGDQGVFVMRKDVDEVLLHAAVVDDKQHSITNFHRSPFTIFEEGKPQSIISFHHIDIPVAMGIIID